MSSECSEEKNYAIKSFIGEYIRKVPLFQLLNPIDLQWLLDGCYQLTGYPLFVTDTNGYVLASSGWSNTAELTTINIQEVDVDKIELRLSDKHKGYLLIAKSNVDIHSEFVDEDVNEPSQKLKRADLVTTLSRFSDMISQIAYEKIKYSTLYDLLKTAVGSVDHPFYLLDADNYRVLIDNSNDQESCREGDSCQILMSEIDKKCECGNVDTCLVTKVKQTLEPAVLEHNFQDENGKTRYLEIRAYPVFDINDKQKVKHVIEYFIDITKRKEREKSFSRFKQALDSSLDSIFIVDFPYFDFVDVNETACYKLGYQKEELLDLKPFHIKPYISKEELEEKFYNLLSCKLEGEQEQTCTEILETYHQRKDGSLFPVELSIRLTTIENEVYFVIVERDITQQKDAEEKMAEYAMELELKNIKIVELYQKLDEEVDKARQVHERTFPNAFPEVSGLDISAYYQAAEKLGGDFYNVLRVNSSVLFYISDVTGHGMEGAIVSTFIKEAINSYVYFCPDNITPQKVLEYLDKKYRDENFPDDYFISIFLGVLNTVTGELMYSSAGFQEIPKARLNTGEQVDLICKNLPITSTVPKELIYYDQATVQLDQGSTILVNTDGLSEQQGVGEEFNKQREDIIDSVGHLPPEILIQTIIEFFWTYNGSLQGDDDITLLALQLQPEILESYRWVLRSDFDELDRVNGEVFPIISRCDCNDCSYHGLHELVTNAIEHGNKFNPDKRVYVELKLTNRYLIISVEDEGDGFNWLEKKYVEKELDYEGDRGRGIMITKQLCESLIYNWKGNKAYLIVDA